MSKTNERSPAGQAGDLGNTSLLGRADEEENRPFGGPPQAQKRRLSSVERARLSLLREYAAETLRLAAHYIDTAIVFAAIEDDASLERSMTCFVGFAREAAKVTREIVDLRKNAAIEDCGL
jgi:hypothetical protein